MIQLMQDDIVYLITTNADSEVAMMIEYMKPLHLVFWNGSYDLGTLKFVPAKLDDLWIAFKIAYSKTPSKSFDLLSSCEFLKYNDLYVDINKKEMQKTGFVRDSYLSQEQLQYASDDVIALSRMYNDDRIRLVREKNLAYRLGIYALDETIQWQQNGLPVLEDKVQEYLVIARAKVEKYMAELEELAGFPLNPRSPLQVRNILGSTSSDKATLTRIVLEGYFEANTVTTRRATQREAATFTPKQQKIAEIVMLARKAKNDVSKLTQYQYPKLYSFFSPMGARTSRYSSKGSKEIGNTNNLQNLARDFKSCFGVKPDSGLIIVAADFATLEIRVACAIMNEPTMHSALMAGEDIHKKTGSLIYDKPTNEIGGRERSNSKVAKLKIGHYKHIELLGSLEQVISR